MTAPLPRDDEPVERHLHVVEDQVVDEPVVEQPRAPARPPVPVAEGPREMPDVFFLAIWGPPCIALPVGAGLAPLIGKTPALVVAALLIIGCITAFVVLSRGSR